MALTNIASVTDFVPEFSTNSIWVDNDVNLCLTDKLTSMESSIGGKANSNHTHSGYAEANHTHNGFATEDHTHEGYAEATHTHSANEITGLPTPVDAYTKTEVDNKLSGKAESNHTHAYLPTAGGDLTGNLNVNGGVIKAKGAQAVYNNGSRITFGGGNLETYAIGTKLYCNQAWSVASDERLKENIAEVDVDKCAEFIKNMDIKTFNYIGNEAPCIGVIAQAVEASELGKYFVNKDSEGYLGVKASDLVFPLIATIQKLQKEIEELKNK